MGFEAWLRESVFSVEIPVANPDRLSIVEGFASAIVTFTQRGEHRAQIYLENQFVCERRIIILEAGR